MNFISTASVCLNYWNEKWKTQKIQMKKRKFQKCTSILIWDHFENEVVAVALRTKYVKMFTNYH